MEHDIPFGNSNRENGTTFLDFPLFLGIFQWDEPTKRVPFTAEPEIPEILTKWKAPHVLSVHRFFFLFRQGFAPFVAKLLVINQINMHTVFLENLISYCFFDNISHTVMTVCEKKKTTTTTTKTTTKKDRENRPSTPWFAVFKCFLLTTFSPISSFSLLQKESKIDT